MIIFEHTCLESGSKGVDDIDRNHDQEEILQISEKSNYDTHTFTIANKTTRHVFLSYLEKYLIKSYLLALIT